MYSMFIFFYQTPITHCSNLRPPSIEVGDVFLVATGPAKKIALDRSQLYLVRLGGAQHIVEILNCVDRPTVLETMRFCNGHLHRPWVSSLVNVDVIEGWKVRRRRPQKACKVSRRCIKVSQRDERDRSCCQSIEFHNNWLIDKRRHNQCFGFGRLMFAQTSQRECTASL
jgi:hypothetical protein